ncbi:MAG TPA: hypothetical protein VFU50_01920 [Terriglobales bacterium]|nr:hypothetical protein [Terriglobales bacterium]
MKKINVLLAVVFFSCGMFLASCSSQVSTNPADYVGEYVYRPDFSDPGKFASFIILEKDHTAIEIRFIKATGEVVQSQRKWDLYHSSDTKEEHLGIGDFSHSIEGSMPHVKLGINDDLGQYYEKVR